MIETFSLGYGLLAVQSALLGVITPQLRAVSEGLRLFDGKKRNGAKTTQTKTLKLKKQQSL